MQLNWFIASVARDAASAAKQTQKGHKNVIHVGSAGRIPLQYSTGLLHICVGHGNIVPRHSRDRESSPMTE